MAFIKHIAGALALISLATYANAAAPARVCDDVEQCVYILERHAPDSFDYQVLHAEFLNFGPSATNALVEVAAWMDNPKSSYAFQMLARGGFQLTPAQQRDLIEVWPRENVEAHALVLGRMASPRVRAAAIDTLEHADPEVRKQSRYLLSQVAKARFKFPMRQGDYSKLLGAALKNPHPALIALLETYPTPQLRPAFARLLRSGDADTTMAVYEKLYKTDKTNALQTLVGVIHDLQDDELNAALAISKMLQNRAASRPDGFYFKLAKDLTEDANLGRAGRAVGYDVLINSGASTHNATPQSPRLPDSPLNREVFKFVVDSNQHSDAYFGYIASLTSNTVDPYVEALASNLGNKPSPAFISALGQFSTSLSKTVTAKAFSHPSDYRMISAAMMTAAKQKQTRLKPKMIGLKSNHPITAVRVAAGIALKELHQPDDKKSSEQLLRLSHKVLSKAAFVVENKNQIYCKVEPTDFKDKSRGMPYFKPEGLNENIQSKREDLSAAAELKTGWLAGYDADEFGGNLLYFDYETKGVINLLSENVIAIIPARAVPLGQYPTSFWVITGVSHNTEERGGIYRVTQRGSEFEVKLHAALPEPARRIAVNRDNSIALDFVNRDSMRRNPKQNRARYMYNPPLLLGPDGSIRRFCAVGSASRTDSTP